MSFRLSSGVEEDEGRAVVHTFFRQLMQAFPKGQSEISGQSMDGKKR